VAASCTTLPCAMNSVTGSSWTASSSSQVGAWNAVTYGTPASGTYSGQTVLVAVGSANTGTGGQRVMTSTDGNNWVFQTPPTAADSVNWMGITWGGNPGKFVAVGDFTSVVPTSPRGMYSADAVTWTMATTVPVSFWIDVAWGGPAGSEKFVAVAFSGTDRAMTSPDGDVWTAVTASTPAGIVTSNVWCSVEYGGPAGAQKFVATAAGGVATCSPSCIMYSTDGSSWTAALSANMPAGSDTMNWKDIAWGNGMWVAVAYVSGSSTQLVMTSLDAQVWTLQTAAFSSNWEAVAFAPPYVFVAVSSSLSNSDQMISP
jgi:hypothetical protein